MTFFPWKAFSKSKTFIQRCTKRVPLLLIKSFYYISVWQNFMSLPPVLHKTKCSDIEGSERTLGRLYYVLYFSYLLAILMLTLRSLWGKAFVVTINNKYLCLGQLLQISILWLFKFSLHRVALDWGSIKYNLDYASLCTESVFLNKTST